MQCEGRHFAVAELKALLAHVLTTFDIELDVPDEGCGWPTLQIRTAESTKSKTGRHPPLKPGRAGLGARPFDEGVPLTATVRLRTALARSV